MTDPSGMMSPTLSPLVSEQIVRLSMDAFPGGERGAILFREMMRRHIVAPAISLQHKNEVRWMVRRRGIILRSLVSEFSAELSHRQGLARTSDGVRP